MGKLCSPSPSTQTQTQTQKQTYEADPRVAEAGEQALGMAQEAAAQPFQMPAAPVAEFTPFQQQTFNQLMGMQGGTDPYFHQAKAGMAEAGRPITQSEIASYMNPYADASLAAMKKYIFDPQRRDTMGRATQLAGGVGADRLALVSQNLDKTQGDALSAALAGFYGPAMQQAQRAKEMALTSAQGWANLGLGEQGAKLQATGALGQAGTQQQQLEQAKLMSPYQQRLAEIAYPFQTAQYLANITGSMAPVFKGTTTGNMTGTTTTTPSQPSMFNQIAGLGLSAAGLAMGNPFMMAGGGGYIPTNTSYLNANYAPFGPTYFPSNRGGAVGRAKGGSVNPYDAWEGYQEGGFTPYDDFGSRFEGPTSNEVVDDRFDGSQKIGDNPTTTQYAERLKALRDYGMSLSQAQGPQDTLPVRAVQTKVVLPQRPQITVNQRPGLPVEPPEDFVERTRGITLPREDIPYPGAADRNWGQQMARSPWMSLVAAGAKMAQSTKSGAAGLAEGIEAGVGHLGEQRKELRSEEAINQKAEQLHREAIRAAREKYQWQPGVGIDPATGQTVSGAYRLPTTGTEPPQFVPGATITGKGSGPTALEKNSKYLVSIGAAASEREAAAMLRQSASDPNRRSTLIRSWTDTIVKNDPAYVGDVEAARRKAEQIVNETYGSTLQQGSPNPGSSRESPAPWPADGKTFERGKWYRKPDGTVDQWLG